MKSHESTSRPETEGGRTSTTGKPSGHAESVDALDWAKAEADLKDNGFAKLPALLSARECVGTAALYSQEALFRSRIVMERYAFGRGEYKYFRYPLPNLVQELRTSLYPQLASIASRWHEVMHLDERFPTTHDEYLAICAKAGQKRPTPLMLKYKEQDYTCLHQDLYGERVFPFQVVFLLSAPGTDFTGGEFMLTYADPALPTKIEVVPMLQGEAVIFAVNSRPVRSARGFRRSTLRHGVSKVHSGHRQTMGIIFHDAK
jgi:hypothetical protein